MIETLIIEGLDLDTDDIEYLTFPLKTHRLSKQARSVKKLKGPTGKTMSIYFENQRDCVSVRVEYGLLKKENKNS